MVDGDGVNNISGIEWIYYYYESAFNQEIDIDG